MHVKYSLVMVTLAAMLLAAPFLPTSSSKSTSPCSNCHNDGRYMYLDILEGDAGNNLPAVINDGETLAVAVVIEVNGSTMMNNVMSAITATLASQNGLFKVAVPNYSIGSLAAGASATAYWNISVLAAGSDVMVVTARGTNAHKDQHFSDCYSPSPTITVKKTAPDVPPSVALAVPAAGEKAKGRITVSGSAANGTRDLVAVEYRVDSGDWLGALGTTSWHFTLDTTKLSNGAHTIEVRAYDGAGYSDIASRSFTVENPKAEAKGFIPMLDGWVVLALVAMVGGLIFVKRE